MHRDPSPHVPQDGNRKEALQLLQVAPPRRVLPEPLISMGRVTDRVSTPFRPAQPDTPPVEPEHLFAKVHNATYALLQTRNFGAPPPKHKKSEHNMAYRTFPPGYNAKFAEEIFARSMKTPVISLSPEELLLISPKLSAKY